MKNPLITLEETELRDLCRHHVDSFEQWSRRIIDESFKRDYGDKYIDTEVKPGQPLIKVEIKRMIENRMQENPVRFPRWIDAIVMENIEYFFCRDDLYIQYFKQIFEPFYSCKDEIRSVLKRLIDIRNKLSHGNSISLHEAEQSLCYTEDFIGCLKAYYDQQGKSREYNVPVFIRIKDSLGNDQIREHMELYPWEIYCTGYHGDSKVVLRSGDTYKIWVEVDGSYPENSYDVTWQFTCGKRQLSGKGNTVEVTFDDMDVSYWVRVSFFLKTHNTWHRRAAADNDDEIIWSSFSGILPPISSTY